MNVPKLRNGKLSERVCGDHKLVNVTIEHDKYHLPTAQDLFAHLAHKGKKIGSAQSEVEDEMPVSEVLVQCLGHTVNANGIKPIQDKVKAIRKAPPATKLTELQSFLCVVMYQTCPPSCILSTSA